MIHQETLDKMNKLYAFIREYQASHGMETPSRRQIAEHMGGISVSVVNYYLGLLRESGRINFEKGIPKTIVLTGRKTIFLWQCPVRDCVVIDDHARECTVHDRALVKSQYMEL